MNPGWLLLGIWAAVAVASVIAIAVIDAGSPSTYVVLGLAAGVAALSAFWLLPRWQARTWTGLCDKDQVEAENNARTTVAQLIGGLGLIATVAITLLEVNQGREPPTGRCSSPSKGR